MMDDHVLKRRPFRSLFNNHPDKGVHEMVRFFMPEMYDFILERNSHNLYRSEFEFNDAAGTVIRSIQYKISRPSDSNLIDDDKFQEFLHQYNDAQHRAFKKYAMVSIADVDTLGYMSAVLTANMSRLEKETLDSLTQTVTKESNKVKRL